MAVLLKKHDSLFLHIPKTGGSWVKEALKRSGMDLGSPNKASRHSLLGGSKRSSVFCFVRHPLTWYVSIWRFKQGRKWVHRGEWSPAKHYVMSSGSSDFNEFVANMIQNQPAFLTRMYEWYIGPIGQEQCTFVGRQERLADDLVTILRKIGYKDGDFNEKVLRSTPVNNASWWKPPVWDEELKAKILQLEKPTLDRWYGENEHVIRI